MLYFWFNLESLITNKRLEKIQTQYVKELKVDWSKIDIKIDSLGWINKNVRINAKDFCINYKNSVFCFKNFKLHVLARPLDPPIVNITKLSLVSENITVMQSDFSKDEEKENAHTPIQETLSSALQSISLVWQHLPEAFNIKLEALFKQPNSQELNLFLTADDSSIFAKTSNIKINIKPKKNSKFKTAETIKIQTNFETTQLKALSTFDLNVSDPAYIDGMFKFTLNSKAQDKVIKNELSTDLKVHLKEETTKVYFENIKASFNPYITSIDSKGCTFELSNMTNKNIAYSCASIVLKPSLSAFENKLTTKHIEKASPLEMKTSGKFNEEVLLTELQKGAFSNAGELSFKLKEVKNSMFNLNFNAQIDLIKSSEGYKPKPINLKIMANILSFSKFVDELKTTSFAIPAPLNQFDGTAFVKIDDYTKTNEGFTIPLKGGLNLNSAKQDSIKVEVEGETKLYPSTSKPTKISTEITVDELSLRLPSFDPASGIPKLGGDSRIVENKTKENPEKDSEQTDDKESAETKNKTLVYNLRLKTKKTDSIKLYYKLFDPFLPLSVKAVAKTEGFHYTLETKKAWSFEYLKRRVKILHLMLKKEHIHSENLLVDSEIMYEASGYNIYINVVGNIDSPAVTLRSDPPLSRKDIISVLLYNRTTNDISRFQNESVGGADSAITDKAIGLIGIWAFAATPIESVSYDSKSNIYRAQIALPGGVKFDIGTDWERIQNVTFRKRVSEYWTVVTSYEPGESSSGVGNMFLQREWIF